MTENPTPPVGDPTPGAGSTPPSYGTPAAPQYGAPQQQPQYGAPQQPYSQPAAGFGGAGAVSDSDRRTWAMLGHLGGIVLGFVAPLIVWIMYKDRDEFLKDQSTEALNFQITMVIAWVVATVLSFVVIGFLLYPVLWIGNLVLCIMAGMAANRGERYRYPFALRLVS
ncbi:MAG: DUF4870 domain-containing protein [Kineosporiaceae bacterium]